MFSSGICWAIQAWKQCQNGGKDSGTISILFFGVEYASNVFLTHENIGEVTKIAGQPRIQAELFIIKAVKITARMAAKMAAISNFILI